MCASGRIKSILKLFMIKVLSPIHYAYSYSEKPTYIERSNLRTYQEFVTLSAEQYLEFIYRYFFDLQKLLYNDFFLSSWLPSYSSFIFFITIFILFLLSLRCLLLHTRKTNVYALNKYEYIGDFVCLKIHDDQFLSKSDL